MRSRAGKKIQKAGLTAPNLVSRDKASVSKKISPEKRQPRRTVCLLTEAEAKGQWEIRCSHHRHVRREAADQMLAEGELTYLDQWKTQAVDTTAVKKNSPTSITETEMVYNALSRLEPAHPAVRAARRKIQLWPHIGDEKATRAGR